MKRLTRSPYIGLVLTGVIASAALLAEAHLPISQDLHFLLQLAWLGIVFAAVLAFTLLPAISSSMMPLQQSSGQTDIPELLDEDRAWLQSHPDSDWLEQR